MAKTTAAVDLGNEAAQLRMSVVRLSRLLRQQADTGLTPTMLSALATVGKHGPLTLGALAERERIAPPTVTQTIARLVERGFVVRRPDPDDGRVTLVAVTSAGKELLASSRRRKTEWLVDRLAALDGDRRQKLLDALDVLESLSAPEPA